MTGFWKWIMNSKNVKEQEREINIKTKRIYTNSFDTYQQFFFIQPLLAHIVLDLVCHENQYVFIFQ